MSWTPLYLSAWYAFRWKLCGLCGVFSHDKSEIGPYICAVCALSEKHLRACPCGRDKHTMFEKPCSERHIGFTHFSYRYLKCKNKHRDNKCPAEPEEINE